MSLGSGARFLATAAAAALCLALPTAAVADPILRHRLIPNFTAQSEGVAIEKIIGRLLEAAPATRAA